MYLGLCVYILTVERNRIVVNYFTKNLIVLCLILLFGCSKAEKNLAEHAYHKAQILQEAEPIIAALNTLVLLEPDIYKGKLYSAQQAFEQLLAAETYLTESNFYLAYLAAHDSYRKLPTIDSKIILIKTGLKLRHLIYVQENLVNAFHDLPKAIPETLLKYETQAVVDWD